VVYTPAVQPVVYRPWYSVNPYNIAWVDSGTPTYSGIDMTARDVHRQR